MKERIIKYLSCPGCKSNSDLKLKVSITDKNTNHIMEGNLECLLCKTIYPIKGGVPFFCLSHTDPIVDLNRKNFADEWMYFTADIDKELAKRELDSYFHNFVTYSDLENKIVLDGGCGGGRFCYVVAAESKAKEIFAVDLSYAVFSAFKNTKQFDNVNIIQGDLTNLPFKNLPEQELFDFIYSVGVLHHLPVPKAGFSSLSKHLKKNGKILVWVYGKEGNALYINFADPIRNLITSKLPFKVNLVLSFTISAILWTIIWLLYAPLNLILPSNTINKILPFNEYFDFFRKRGFKDFWRTVLDKMIPTISYYISKNEFVDWFKANNLNYKLYFRNGHSWVGIGEYPTEANVPSEKHAEVFVSTN